LAPASEIESLMLSCAGVNHAISGRALAPRGYGNRKSNAGVDCPRRHRDWRQARLWVNAVPTPAFMLARVFALTASAWLPLSDTGSRPRGVDVRIVAASRDERQPVDTAGGATEGK
jgi:hypothetical protein